MAMSGVKAELNNWLTAMAASAPGSVSAITDQTIGTISEDVAGAVVTILHRNGYYWSETDHVVCDFLAATAHTMQQAQDQLEHAVSDIVTAILTARRRDHRSAIPMPLATIAAQAAVSALTKLQAVRQFDDLLRATRILAITMCPAPEHHRAVVLYCISPLEKDILSDAIRHELTDSLPRGWMTPMRTSTS